MWYAKVSKDISYIPDAVEYFNAELQEAVLANEDYIKSETLTESLVFENEVFRLPFQHRYRAPLHKEDSFSMIDFGDGKPETEKRNVVIVACQILFSEDDGLLVFHVLIFFQFKRSSNFL